MKEPTTPKEKRAFNKELDRRMQRVKSGKSKGISVDEFLGKLDCRVKENVLQEADRLTAHDRNAAYGHPAEDFKRVAGAFNVLTGHTITPEQVAIFMICVKLSRECHKHKRDNLVDIAGYAKCLHMTAEVERAA